MSLELGAKGLKMVLQGRRHYLDRPEGFVESLRGSGRQTLEEPNSWAKAKPLLIALHFISMMPRISEISYFVYRFWDRRVSRWGGHFDESLFQIVLPQGMEALLEWPRLREALVVGPVLVPQGTCSLEVAAGLTGENGPLAPIDDLRFDACWPSASQEERRVGFGPGLLFTGCKRWN